VHLRSILGNIGVLVLPEQKSIPNAAQLFNEDGSLNDPKQQQDIENLGAKLAQVVAKLNA
jgi:chromate reductase